MIKGKTIQLFEYDWLTVGESYDGIVFSTHYYRLFSKYLIDNPKNTYFTSYYNKLRFNNYVGVIKAGDLTVEVLPKTDRHTSTKTQWQNVLLKMLSISLQVEAKITTKSNILLRKHSVLETYLLLFLDEAEKLLHEGLIKKYRQYVENQSSLKGRLLVHKQITTNIIHQERFYVKHQTYDRNNIFNAVLLKTLQCISSLNVSDFLTKRSNALVQEFPECSPISISEKVFDIIRYDRKSERYKTAMELSKIILLNYHPDVKSGENDILAIMFDMNVLWENYVYWMIKKAAPDTLEVIKQGSIAFWRHPDEWSLHLRPDIVVKHRESRSVIVLDTKWKYQKDATMEDVRQMYAYGKYFGATKNYLLYPDRLENDRIVKREGSFYKPSRVEIEDNQSCGLMFIDLLDIEQKLDVTLGNAIINNLSLTQ